jgi:hypothetical protein
VFSLGPDYPKIEKPAQAPPPLPQLTPNSKTAADLDKERAIYLAPLRIVSAHYKAHAYELLAEYFTSVGKSDLRVLHNRFHGCYAPTFFELYEDRKLPSPRHAKLKRERPVRDKLARIGNEELRKEKEWVDRVIAVEETAFAQRKRELQRIADEKKALELADKDEEANGLFLQCGCCFGDFPGRKIVTCAEGHLFCQE